MYLFTWPEGEVENGTFTALIIALYRKSKTNRIDDEPPEVTKAREDAKKKASRKTSQPSTRDDPTYRMFMEELAALVTPFRLTSHTHITHTHTHTNTHTWF
jgi:hypothetical protein